MLNIHECHAEERSDMGIQLDHRGAFRAPRDGRIHKQSRKHFLCFL
jgi:hypothetical protein